MVGQYEKICNDHGCKAKIFVKEKNSLKKKIGSPDLIVLFTNTVSHSMVLSAVNEAKRTNAKIARVHSSSKAALEDVLEAHCS
jgi:late competence protein required for DNA uptake (superfamily II DNA/RNA helicase)